MHEIHFSVSLFILYLFQVEEAIEVALETGCRVHGSQEGVTKKEILEFVKKVFKLTDQQVDEAEEKSSQQVATLNLNQLLESSLHPPGPLPFSRLNYS